MSARLVVMLSAAAAWVLDAIAPNACLPTMLTVLMQTPYLARLGGRTAGYLSRLPNQLWDMPTLSPVPCMRHLRPPIGITTMPVSESNGW
jgi:hypothetical protein